MAFFRSLSRKAPEVEVTTTSIDAGPGAVLTEGSLEYTVARGGNDSLPSYQEASGAPVETISPLGYFVGPVTVIFLNISMMIGTGVYSTRDSPCGLDRYFSRWLTALRSRYYPQGHWVCGVGFTVLAAGIPHLIDFFVRVSGVRRLFPQSIRCRGRIPRASVPPSDLFLSPGLRASDRYTVLQQRQFHRWVSQMHVYHIGVAHLWDFQCLPSTFSASMVIRLRLGS